VSGTPDYVRFTLHPRPGKEDAAASTLLDLPTPGWQELEDGAGSVFWLARATLEDPSVREVLERLRALGSLEAAAEASDWERRWRRFHEPVRIGRLLVRPPWAPADPEALDVLVDVGMAFGTGAHHTTRQCLRLLQDVVPGALLDAGCGTGVLSIAAVRLGYGPVRAVDIDEMAVSTAAANALLNGVHVDLSCADVTDPAERLPAVDVLVANVALRPIVALGGRYAAGAQLPRDVILAGLLAPQADEAAAAWPAYTVVRRQQDEEWCALHLRRAAATTAATGAVAPDGRAV